MKSHLELFRRLEREIRLAGEKLPIDAFLPALEALPTEFRIRPRSMSLPSRVRWGGAWRTRSSAARSGAGCGA